MEISIIKYVTTTTTDINPVRLKMFEGFAIDNSLKKIINVKPDINMYIKMICR